MPDAGLSHEAAMRVLQAAMYKSTDMWVRVPRPGSKPPPIQYLRLWSGFREPASGACALYLHWSPPCRQHDADPSEPTPDNRRPR